MGQPARSLRGNSCTRRKSDRSYQTTSTPLPKPNTTTPPAAKLDWFVSEQVEEEETAQSLIDRLKLIGDNGLALYMLDQELATRVFNVPSPLANA